MKDRIGNEIKVGDTIVVKDFYEGFDIVQVTGFVMNAVRFKYQGGDWCVSPERVVVCSNPLVPSAGKARITFPVGASTGSVFYVQAAEGTTVSIDGREHTIDESQKFFYIKNEPDFKEVYVVYERNQDETDFVVGLRYSKESANNLCDLGPKNRRYYHVHRILP